MRAVLVVLALQTAAAGGLFSVDTKESTLTYYLRHPVHSVRGVSRSVEGRARLLPTGVAQVEVRAPVASFDSGNVNRDADMKAAVEAARFPFVELKAVAEGLPLPAAFPATIDRTFRAQLTFHGVRRQLEIPVRLVFASPDRVTAAARFTISLEAFGIERPSLFLVKVDDALRIETSLVLRRER